MDQVNNLMRDLKQATVLRRVKTLLRQIEASDADNRTIERARRIAKSQTASIKRHEHRGSRYAQ